MVQQIGLAGRMDLQQFNSGVQSFMRSLNDMNRETTRVAKESAAGAKEAGEATRRFGVGWERVKDIVTGVLIIDVFRQVSRGLKSVVRDAFDATAVFQTLMITMSAILARDFAKEWGIPVADALGQITEKAQELLGWVRQIAVTTPFSVESLGTALAYGQAFGFNVEQSKRLTLATGDFVSGMGLTDEHMRRIIYNFGQMLASGRVLGRELRDLANNFVPIRDITQRLADEAGIPFEEMKLAMSDAKVSAEQFIGTFVQLAEEDFEGAMERMARTIRGVEQNISDFVRTLFGLELLGPVMEEIAGRAADALDAAFSEETIRAFTVLGQTLLVAFNNVADILGKILMPAIKDFFAALGFGAPTVFNIAYAILFMTQVFVEFVRALRNVIVKITDFVNTLSDKLGVTLGDIAKTAAGWGANIVISLAEGMASAITYIVQVLTAIARIFTYWLRGGSPPKLLPDLTLWGRQAMEAWLEGWTSADFGLFSDIASVVGSFIRSMAHMIPKADLIPKIIGARSTIERAIDDIRKFGSVTEASINNIVNAVGAGSSALRDFIRETFEFAKISAKIKAVKKILAFDIEFNIPVKILGQTVSTLQDLAKLANRFKGDLGDALKGYVQALGDVERANERVERAQKSLNDITEKYSKQLNALRRLQEALRKKESFSGRIKQIEAALATGLLTTEEKRRLELEKEEIILTHKIAAIENERDVAVEAARDRLTAEEKIADEAEKRLERQQRMTKIIADEQLAAAKEQLDSARALVEMQIESNNLLQEQVRILEQLAKGKGEGEEFDIPGLDFEGFVDELEDSILASKEAIAQAVDDLRAEVFAKIQEFIKTITSPFEGVAETLGGLLAEITGVFETAKEDTGIQRFIVSLYVFQDRMQQALVNLRTFWEENGPGIAAIIQDFFDRLSEVIDPKSVGLLTLIAEGIEGFGEKIVEFSEKLIADGPAIQESLRGWVDWVFETGIPKLQDFGKTLTEDIVPAIRNFVGILVENKDTIIPIILGIATAFKALSFAAPVLFAIGKAAFAIVWIIEFFKMLIAPIITFVQAIGGLTAIKGILAGLGAFIAANFAPIIAIVIALVGVFLAVRDHAEELRDIFIKVFAAVKKAVEPALKPLLKAFKDLKPAFDALMKSLKPVGQFLLGVLKAIGLVILGIVVPALITIIGVVTGLFRGIVEAITGFLEGLQTVWFGLSKIVDGIVKIFTGLWDIIAGIFTLNGPRIAEGFKTLMAGIGDVLVGLVVSIIGNIEVALKFIYGLFAGFINGIIDFFVSLYNSLIGKSIIPDMLRDIVKAFTKFFTDTVANFVTWVSNIVTSVTSKFSEVLQAGRDFLQNLIDGIREKVFGETGIIAKVKSWIEDTIEGAKLKLAQWKALGKEFLDNLIEGIRQKIEGALGLWAKFTQWIKDTIAKIGELKDDVVQAGKDFILGFIEGLWAKAVDLYNAVAAIIKNALGIGEETAESSSYSKRTYRLGEDWMNGLIAGLNSRSSAVERTMQKLFTDFASIPEGMQLDMSTLMSELENVEGIAGGLDIRHLVEPTAGAASTLTQPSPTQTTIQNLNVEVNPTYREVESEASIYYDVQAALAHVIR